MGDEKNKKFSFINEKVLNKKADRGKKTLRTVLFVCLCAVFFGLVSGVTFYLFGPHIAKYFNPQNPEEGGDLVVSEKETTSGEDETTTAEEMTTISVEEVVKLALEEYGISMDDYGAAYEKLGMIGEKMEKSMVTVVANKSEEWFNERTDVKSVTSGIIVRSSEEDGLLILTDYESVMESKSLMVYLHNGKGYKADFYKTSELVGITLLRIDSKAIDEVTRSELSPIDTSAFRDTKLSRGEKVVLMGNPYGTGRYMAYGVLTSVSNIVDRTDIRYEIMTTDISSSGSMNGFIIDLDGNLIGMVIRKLEPESMAEIVSAVHLKDICMYLNKIIEGYGASYLGIDGQEVTDEIIHNVDKDMPHGIYIMGTVEDSPAFNAGIMNGDILVAIEGQNITDIYSYMEILQSYTPGTPVDITVMRKGKDGYKEIVYSAVIGSK